MRVRSVAFDRKQQDLSEPLPCGYLQRTAAPKIYDVPYQPFPVYTCFFFLLYTLTYIMWYKMICLLTEHISNIFFLSCFYISSVAYFIFLATNHHNHVCECIDVKAYDESGGNCSLRPLNET